MLTALARLRFIGAAALHTSWRRMRPGREAGTFAGLADEIDLLCASRVPSVRRSSPQPAAAPAVGLAA